MNTSVRLRLGLNKGAKITVTVDPKHPYTVLYDKRAKRMLGVATEGQKTITLDHPIDDMTSLLLLGNKDEDAWTAMKTSLENGGDPGSPGTAGDGNGRVS